MLLGFAVTRHCNLRCEHCIRDDVTDVTVLPVEVVASVTDQALELFDDVGVSLTGGEPLIHPDFEGLAAVFGERGVPWRFTTNGWHLGRAMPVLDEHPPGAVRLSLSGGSEETHDGERGRGSWRRLMTGIALLTSRRIPTYLSLVVDERDRHELRDAADLAEGLGVVGLSYILPQPVPGSAARGSDIPPGEWRDVRDEVRALAAEAGRRTRITLDYGHPVDGPEPVCQTFRRERIYVDPDGCLSTCCQLSDYGGNRADVVAALAAVPLEEALARYDARLDAQWEATRPGDDADDPLADFPCLRCARAQGKLGWLRDHPDSPWRAAADHAPAETPTLVTLTAAR